MQEVLIGRSPQETSECPFVMTHRIPSLKGKAGKAQHYMIPSRVTYAHHTANGEPQHRPLGVLHCYHGRRWPGAPYVASIRQMKELRLRAFIPFILVCPLSTRLFWVVCRGKGMASTYIRQAPTKITNKCFARTASSLQTVWHSRCLNQPVIYCLRAHAVNTPDRKLNRYKTVRPGPQKVLLWPYAVPWSHLGCELKGPSPRELLSLRGSQGQSPNLATCCMSRRMRSTTTTTTTRATTTTTTTTATTTTTTRTTTTTTTTRRRRKSTIY